MEGVTAGVSGGRGWALVVPSQREGEGVPRDDVRGECQTAGGGVTVRVVVLLDERGRIAARSRDRVGYSESEGVTAGVGGRRGRALVVPSQREGQGVAGGDRGGECQTARSVAAVRGVGLLDKDRRRDRRGLRNA